MSEGPVCPRKAELLCWTGSELCASYQWVTECVLCVWGGGAVITVVMVTAKRDQKAYVNALLDNKNTYYSLVLDTSYLSKKLTFAVLFLDKDTFLVKQVAHQNSVNCI